MWEKWVWIGIPEKVKLGVNVAERTVILSLFYALKS